jgi:3-hydroxyisobutyrate dehydrogenase/2-hydroxy-3-oxopropionate reductase
MMPGMGTVAVVGLGQMGGRMARRLLDAGHDLVVWNRSPEKAAPLVEAGASAAPTAREAAAAADVVLTMLTGPDALAAVSDDIAAGAGDATVIEMSTVGPAAIAKLRAALPPETGLLDAPVLGSLAEVEAGKLRIFVGGEGSLFDRWQPLLAVLGAPTHVGPLGSGAAAKLVANSTLFGTIGVLGEALSLARGLGLSDEAAFAVLAATPIAAQAERRREAIAAGDFRPRFALSLARKDADLVADAAADAGIDLRLATAARTWLADAERAGLGEADYSAVLAQILDDSR